CGVHRIVPIHCKRTENNKIKLDRLDKIIASSAKQTLRPLRPEINELVDFKIFVKGCASYSQRFIAHCESDSKLFLGNTYNPKVDAVVLIGPAGDFTLEEIQLAKETGFIPVSLGDYRLRTETAGLSALLILQTIRNR
ncbi:MAG: RsmE family RNA methyltransferase, partial [Saprospiraceae bacterium]